MKLNRRTIEEVLNRHIRSAPEHEMESDARRVLRRLRVESEKDADPVVDEDIRDVRLSRPARPVSRVPRFAWATVAVFLALAFVVVRNFVFENTAPAFIEPANTTVEGVTGDTPESVPGRKPIALGDVIHSNDQSGVVVVLKDGSRIEVRSRSELVLEAAEDGIRIRLNAGSIIVTAAEQRKGHLYVRTKDLTAAVVGTVFVVKAEESGSRVAVIQGEVHVQQGVKDRRLLPGEQVATNPLMEPQAVSREVSWSRQAELHLAQLQQAVAPAALKPLEFEAASVRLDTYGGAESGIAPQCQGVDGFLRLRNPSIAMLRDMNPNFQPSGPVAPKGRCIARHTSLVTLMGLAYSVDTLPAPDFGGPQWAHDGPGGQQFQLEAKAENPATATKGQLQEMLQTLLAEKFQLKLSWQSKEFQGYVMYVGKDGHKLPEALTEENLKLVTQRVGEIERRTISGKAPMKEFLDFIGLRPPLLPGPGWKDGILDRTDLSGIYTFNLTYIVPPVTPTPGEGGRRGGAPGGNRPAFSNMVEALQEQLGLRLESAKIPTDIPVIDHVEMPSDN